MSVSCPQCGRFDCVEKATGIVARGTESTTIQVQGVVNGNAVQYPQNVSTQSGLAQNLTADEPRLQTNCAGIFIVVSIMIVLLLAALLSCTGLTYMSDGVISHRLQLLFVLLVSVVGIIALSVISSVVSGIRTKRFNQQHNYWYANHLDRRYYCYSCDRSFQR